MSETDDVLAEYDELRKKMKEEYGYDPADFSNFDSTDFQPPAPDPFFDYLANPNSNPEDIQAFINKGENINRTRIGLYKQEESAASIAAKHPNPEVLRTVLNAGAEPNFKTQHGYTPYFNAVSLEHLQVLIEHGAIYPEPTSYGETPLRTSYHIADQQAIRFHLENGAPVSEIDASPIHLALLFGNENLAQVIQESSSSIEAIDTWHRTPLLLAFQLGDLEAIDILVANGANLEAVDHVGQTGIHLAAMSNNVQALIRAEQYGLGLETQDEFKHTALNVATSNQRHETIDYILERLLGRPDYFQIIDKAAYDSCDPYSIQKLIEAGAKLDSFDSETRWEMNPAKNHNFDLSKVSKSEFKRAKTAMEGRTNPHEHNEPFWQAMIINRSNAYNARNHFNHKPKFRGLDTPVWCADRFGQSLTPLPDGRVIEIAGEHEDHYDPDFCIYNDVFVHEPGKLPRVFLYPSEIFPPTDFHTATLMGVWIYIIGSLGYPESRNDDICPIYRLNIHTLFIEKVEAHGDDPGRIYKHRAIKLSESEILIRDGGKCANSQKFDAPHSPSIFNIEDKTWRTAAVN